MLNINNYKFYVRDIGVQDIDLENILKDVLSDIAINTKIFKRTFGFTLEPEVSRYPIRDLYQLNDKTEATITDINFTTDFSNTQSLIDYLSSAGTVPVGENISTSVDNKYSDYIETIDVFDNKFNSYLKYLEAVNKNDYYINTILSEPVDVNAIVSVNPILDELDEKIEKQIRFAIISGLKAYTHTLENQVNEPVGLTLNKQFEYDKQKLINQYPYFGLSKKGFKNDSFSSL